MAVLHTTTFDAATAVEPGDLAQIVARRAGTQLDAPFVTDARSQRRLSFAELAGAVLAWEIWLSASGIRRGEAVALCVADPLEFCSAYVSIIATGRWVAPIDPTAPAAATDRSLDRLGPALLISDRPEPAARFGGLLGGVPGSGGLVASLPLWPAVVTGRGRTDVPHGISSGGALLFSSGSTGTPKLIPLHEHQLLDGARAVAGELGLEPGETGFSPLPMFHINAQVVGVLAALWAGSGLVVDARFHRTGFWDLMDRHGVTWVNAVPAIISHLCNGTDGESVPGRIRFIRSASAPLPAATLRRFEAVTGIPVVETYGMTEAAGQIAANPVQGPRKPGSVGRPVGFELRIDSGSPDEESRPGGPHVPGHVEIRGRRVGWSGDATSTAHRSDPDLHEPWFGTGDLGYLDDDGYLFLVGRRDDVINRGGEKVYPREIEEVLRLDPRVSEAVVIGREHGALGQVPVAFISVRGVRDRSGLSTALTVGEVAREHLHEALPLEKCPVAIHVVGRLPTTGNGKVARRQVEDAEILVTLA